MTSMLLFLALAAAPATPDRAVAPPGPAANTSEPVILFVVDNSASLPPLDPEEKRVEALERVFSFLKGQRYRLILFGAKSEISVDDVTRYRNNGQWTDFYNALDRARQLMGEYPSGTQFRLILLTDGILDPDPKEWPDVPHGTDLKAYVVQRTLELLRQIHQPLYVILVGEPPTDGSARDDREQTPTLIWDMVQAANGAEASAMAQTLSSFFDDNGVLLKKFIFRVAPDEGLKKVEPIVARIVAPSNPGLELQILGKFVLPLSLFLFLLLGILVRSFPGAGDTEVVELKAGIPAHLVTDRLHRLDEGGWAPRGLSLVSDAREAVATLTYQAANLDLSGDGLETGEADELTLRYLKLDLDALARALERAQDEGSKEEKIFALNLDYMGKNFDAKEAQRLLTANAAERRRIQAIDFLRAKVHLVSSPDMKRRLTEQRVQLNTYGKDAQRRDLSPGDRMKIPPYSFQVRDIIKGGRKDVRVFLAYERVPSTLGLKAVLPRWFQRAFRLRRRSERYVS